MTLLELNVNSYESLTYSKTPRVAYGKMLTGIKEKRTWRCTTFAFKNKIFTLNIYTKHSVQ